MRKALPSSRQARVKADTPIELSKYLWNEIGQDPNTRLDRLTLGPNGQHWGVRDEDDSFCYFASVDQCGSFERKLNTNLQLFHYHDFDFVALGEDGDWAFSVNGSSEQRCSNSLRKALLCAKRSNKRPLVRG